VIQSQRLFLAVTSFVALCLVSNLARAEALAVWGEPAPVAGNPVFLNNANSDVLPVMNDTGGVAFQADFQGGEGVFAACDGPLSAVVLAGDPSPDGGTFTAFDETVVGIDEACSVAVHGRGSLRRHVVAVREAGVMRLVARNLDPAPGSCGSFSDFEAALGVPSMNSDGQVAFRAATTSCADTVVVDTAGSQAVVVQSNR
jgi:hypothetical protein